MQKSFQTGMNHLSWCSSAAVECVLSILANSFSSRQEAAVEDYIQLNVIIGCNIISEKSNKLFFFTIVF